MAKYALINNNVVTGVVDVFEDHICGFIQTNDMVINIDNQSPQPTVGYILNGNVLEFPQGESSREQFEIDLNARKSIFGQMLAQSAANRIGARNKILNKNGSQVVALLTQLLNIKVLLETGALGTARAACVQLQYVYTEYADIFQEVIISINDFEANFGL